MDGNPSSWRSRIGFDGDDAEVLVNLNARVPKHLWRRVRLQSLREYLHARQARRA